MMGRTLATPWKGLNEIRRYLAWPLIRAYFAVNGVAWGQDWRVYGRPLIQRHTGSRIVIGGGLHMRNWFSTNPLGVVHRSILATWSADAEIRLGENINMTGTTICASQSVRIGNHIRLGANSSIIDTNFHPVDPVRRRNLPREGDAEGVVIEDDVFVGMNVLILKGTTLRRGTVVGAGSVVSGDFPPDVVIGGNPARVVRELESHAHPFS
jgi:acetyltransferase-like isoleucine patch superfamily enzyme